MGAHHRLTKILFLPDTHTPYHDARAVEGLIIERVMPGWKPDVLVILGDWFDNYAVSRFTKNPKRLRGLQAELEVGVRLLRRFEAFPFKRRIFLEGNHEARLLKATADKMPEVYEFMERAWATLFTAGKWEYVPYMEDIHLGKLYATHDVGRAGEQSTRLSLVDYQDNVVIGHNHLMDFVVRSNAKGIPHVGASFGWLGDVLKIDYRHRMKSRRDYVLGFGVGYLRPNGLIHIVPVPIVQYSALVEGVLYVG
jgi:predicted phosphodiesterase